MEREREVEGNGRVEGAGKRKENYQRSTEN